MNDLLVPLIFNLGPTELLIILAIVLLLFGGARLAGLGKSTGRAIKEFKEETKGIRGNDEATNVDPPPAAPAAPAPPASTYQQPPDSTAGPSTSDPR